MRNEERVQEADWSSAEYWNLNEEQSLPFLHNGHCAVVACPGSGKTRLLIAKMVRLIGMAGVENVMAVTFTKASAKEMRKRLAAVLGSSVARKAKVETFHKFAYEQIRDQFSGKKPKFLNEAEEAEIILRSRDRMNIIMSDEEAISAVHLWKRATSYPEIEPGDAEKAAQWDLYQDYRRTLMGMMAIDMDSMISEVVRRYRSKGPDKLEPNAVRYLLVDEYQDSDHIQVEWILDHVKQGTKVTVVGDDDQSIYRFRQALGVTAYRLLANRIGEDQIRLFRLQTNYRCAREVVRGAGELIEKNQQRIPKAFVAFQKEPGNVQKLTFGDRTDEAEAVIDHFLKQGRSMAVLSRTRAWLAGVELVARSREVPVISVENGSFLDQAHVRRALAGFQHGIDPDNRVCLFEAIAGLGLKGKPLRLLEEKFRRLPQKESVMDAIYHRTFFDDFDRDSTTALRDARKVLGEWSGLCEEYGSWDEGFAEKMQKGVQRLGEHYVEANRNNERRDDIRLLSEIIGKRMKGSIQDRIEALLGKKDKKDGAPGLELMTMHGSKGLEFPEVWIVGCSDGHVPKLDEETDIEEERRLLYVAMTRAEKGLTLSAVVRKTTGRDKNWEASRFFSEFAETEAIEQECVESQEENPVIDGSQYA